MLNFYFSRRAAYILTALLGLLLAGFSNVRADGYQLSQNLQSNQILSSNFQLSSDGKYVVYQVFTNQNGFQGSQLFSVNAATGSRKALTPLVIGDGKFIGQFKIAPNGQFVVFNASLESDAINRSELYSIPITANNPNMRENIGNIPATLQANINDFSISPNSLHVVYQMTEQNAVGDFFGTLNRVAPGGGATTLLTPHVSTDFASEAVFAPDSSRIVYLSGTPDGERYKSVSLDGTGRKTLTDQRERMTVITPDSQRIVYLANSSPRGDGEDRIYSVTLTGNGNRKQLSRNGEQIFDFKFANGIPTVIYSFMPASDPNFSPTSFGFVPADRSELSVSYNINKAINSYIVSPDNLSIIYRGAQFLGGASQLYSLTFPNNVALDQQISNAPINQAGFLNVNDFKITPNSQRVIFHAQQGNVFSFPPDLFSVAIANNPVSVKLDTLPGEDSPNAAQYGVGSYFISPDSQRVIFGYSLTDGSCCGNNLYTNSVTGGTPPAFATNADDQFFQTSVKFASDGLRVIYVKNIYDEFGNYLSAAIWAANVPQ